MGLADLMRRFERAEVKTVDLDGAEGRTERGTAIRSPDRARRLWWSATGRDGAWRSLARLGLGGGLCVVEAPDGRPFAIDGFFWDQGSFATDWRGGSSPDAPLLAVMPRSSAMGLDWLDRRGARALPAAAHRPR